MCLHDATQRIVDRAQLAIVEMIGEVLGDAAQVYRCRRFTNVRKYAEGIQDWAGAGLPTESELVPDAASTT